MGEMTIDTKNAERLSEIWTPSHSILLPSHKSANPGNRTKRETRQQWLYKLNN